MRRTNTEPVWFSHEVNLLQASFEICKAWADSSVGVVRQIFLSRLHNRMDKVIASCLDDDIHFQAMDIDKSTSNKVIESAGIKGK
jgi:hypothetical protein